MIKNIKNRNGHWYVNSWIFESEEEKDLANSMAVVAEMNGVEINEFRYTFSLSLRMLKHKGKRAR